jgi:hypothetical protein
MINRKQALAIIRCEYATHGKETRDSIHYSIVSGVSYEAYRKAVREGLDIYDKKGDDIK